MRRRRAAKDEHDSSERWLVSYADFITLMFAFFAVLYATSDQNLEKSRQLQESIKRYLIPFGAAGGSGHEVNQGTKENSAIDSPIKTYPTDPNDKTRSNLEQTEIFIEEKLLRGSGKDLIEDISPVESGVRITLNASTLFAKQSVKFRPEAMEPLDVLCQYLSTLRRRLVIEAHTSPNSSPSSSYPSDWEFAAGRATSFVRFLIRRYHFPAQQLAAVSYGSERPLFSSEDPQAVAKNQRLDILVLSNDNIF